MLQHLQYALWPHAKGGARETVLPGTSRSVVHTVYELVLRRLPPVGPRSWSQAQRGPAGGRSHAEGAGVGGVLGEGRGVRWSLGSSEGPGQGLLFLPQS